jgi:hypothetical protein
VVIVLLQHFLSVNPIFVVICGPKQSLQNCLSKASLMLFMFFKSTKWKHAYLLLPLKTRAVFAHAQSTFPPVANTWNFILAAILDLNWNWNLVDISLGKFRRKYSALPSSWRAKFKIVMMLDCVCKFPPRSRRRQIAAKRKLRSERLQLISYIKPKQAYCFTCQHHN